MINELKEKIEIAKADVKVCMDDFERGLEVNSNYPIGIVDKDFSKSEIYNRGRLRGLEEALIIMERGLITHTNSI